MTAFDPFASALAQAAAIARRDVTPSELASQYQRRIARYNDALNAYCLTTPELINDGADVQPAGPLSGVSVSIKDLAPMAGYPFTRGSRAFRHDVAKEDAFAVARLKEAGCIILGRTTTAELGGRPVTDHGLHGAARNPWNLEYTAGGSSGGAAAAVASGLCALSHGSDGGGSVRIPAACCGVVGLKPSRGRISLGPTSGAGWGGLLTDGVLARTVADVAAGLDAMAGHLAGDPYWAAPPTQSFLTATNESPARTLRIAFTADADVAVDPEIATHVSDIAALCEQIGHRVEECGPKTQSLREPQTVIFAASMAAQPVSDRSLLDPANAVAAEFGDGVSAADYVRAVDGLHAESRKVIAFWEEYDVLITPTFPRTAPRLGEMGADPSTAGHEHLDWLTFTYPANCTGQPAISLPLATHSNGLPVGIQLVGPPQGEAMIIALSAQLEAARPWVLRPPVGWD